MQGTTNHWHLRPSVCLSVFLSLHTLINSTSRHSALTEVLVMGRCIDMCMFMVVLIMVLMLYAYRIPWRKERTQALPSEMLMVQKLIVLQENNPFGWSKSFNLPAKTHCIYCSGPRPTCHFCAPWTRVTPFSSSRKLQKRNKTEHPWKEANATLKF